MSFAAVLKMSSKTKANLWARQTPNEIFSPRVVRTTNLLEVAYEGKVKYSLINWILLKNELKSCWIRSLCTPRICCLQISEVQNIDVSTEYRALPAAQPFQTFRYCISKSSMHYHRCTHIHSPRGQILTVAPYFVPKSYRKREKKLYVILPYLLASVNKLWTQRENWKVFLQQIFQ